MKGTEGIVNPVNEKGKADFGVDIGDVLQLQYIDKDPPHGWRKHLNKVFTCKVERYLVEKVVRKKGEVVAGGSVVVNLLWVGGPADFMSKIAKDKKLERQTYTPEDFKQQFQVINRENSAKKKLVPKN